MDTTFTPVSALIGGALIGLAATLLMATLGRIAGISGIYASVLKGEGGWQTWFLVGLLVGAGGFFWLGPDWFEPRTGYPLALLLGGGLLVGYGTRLGSGCTSGHGVCGLARFSGRSLAATITFMVAAVLTVYVVHHLLGWGR